MKVVNIYTPTYYRFEKTKRALESIIESVDSSENDVNFFIGDNNTKDETMRGWLKSLARSDEKIKVFMAEKNIGKAAIINHMHKKTRDCDYFISIDSDMVAYENNKYNWVDELVKLMEWEPAKNFGLFSTWQDEFCAHVLNLQKERTEFMGHFIKYGNFSGVAGGCVIVRNEDFLKIGRYIIHDIYSGDDALLMRNISNLGKLVGITETIRLIHQANTPDETDYQKWKVDKCRGKIKVGADTKGFWD